MAMRNLVVFDHPYGIGAWDNVPHRRSFSAALCKSLTDKMRERGEEVDVIDLVADAFDPAMSAEGLARWRAGVPIDEQTADYQRRLVQADRIVFVFPLWWELMPARTKGFIDKVYAKDILYSQEPGLKGMKTRIPHAEFVFVTVMGTPRLLYRIVLGSPLMKAMRRGLCFKTGIKRCRWVSYSGVDKLSKDQRKKLLLEADV